MYFKETFSVEPVSPDTPQASPAGLAAFVEAEVGLTAHWGLYSVLGRHEWCYFNDRFAYADYRQVMQRFNPVRFDAAEWADLLLEVGVKFFTITAKHHDGFCLWDTRLTDFTITRTPFRRDVLAELSRALQERGIGLHFYYSLVDWTHPAYRADWAAYVAYYQGQVRELCTAYGPIAGFIFDGYWPRQGFEGDEIAYFQPGGPWDLAGTYRLIHQLQPDAVIGNNTHAPPLPGEDYQVWELDLPGENTQGFNALAVGSRPTASWLNLNRNWGYRPAEHRVMPLATLLDRYERTRAQGAVLMLNVGPRPFGDIHPEEQSRLREFGAARSR
ncbi:MAG: alpha-L-fucosidase [Anaerolineae bacterium]|nr:alpha-L-fucosidase [Anaerolineae bacterium]